MSDEGPKKDAEQILEPVALTEDPGFLEGCAGRKGLERLDEAVRGQSFEELFDRPWAALDPGAQAVAVSLIPEAKRRHEDVEVVSVMIEGHGIDMARPVRHGHDGIARAEIDTKGNVVRMGRHGRSGQKPEK